MPYVDPIPQLKRDACAQLAPLLAGWNAHDIAAVLGTQQARVSDLNRGKLDRFSLETLLRFVARLNSVPTLIFEERPRDLRPVRSRR